MGITKAKVFPQYDFSGGINISVPGNEILDNESFASIDTYDETRNVYWDAGIIKRKGTLKVNTYPGLEFIANGDCETNNPIIIGETTAQAVENGTWAKSGTQKYAGSYSWLLTKTTASGAGNAKSYFCDSNLSTDLHGLTPGHSYNIEAYVYTDAATVANCKILFQQYYGAQWNTSSISCSSKNAFHLLSSTITLNASATGIIFALWIDNSEATGTKAYIDEIQLTDVAEYINNGVRFYRSTSPTKTTFVGANYPDETKLLYIDSSNAFQNLSGGTAIAADKEVYFAIWKDAAYIATGNTVVQKITYSSGWSRANIAGLSYKPQFICQHKDRLWVASGDMPEGYLECCGYDDDTDWAGGDGYAFNVGFKDGDPITQLLSLGDNLAVYKNDSIWLMKGDNVQNWFQDKADDAIGCVAPKSAVNIGFGHIFLGPDNIYFFDGEQLLPIGNKVKPWLDLIPLSLRKKASATYFNNYYRLAFASSSMSTHNDLELILDLRYFRNGKFSWWINSSRNISSYVPYNGPEDANTLYFCDHDAGYVRRIDFGTQDDGVDISGEWHSKYYSFDIPNLEKMYDRLKVDTSQGVGTFTLDVFRNVSNDFALPISIDATGASSSYSSAVLGTTYWTSQATSRQTTEIALPSDLDGNALAIKLTHSDNYDNTNVYGFSVSWAYKGF